VAYRLWGVASGQPARMQSRLAALHGFLVHKWYFDELIDAIVVRPAAFLGRGARDVVERVLIDGALVGGATAGVRALSTAVRSAQSGYVRYYAGLLFIGLASLGAYFLMSA
jgi:NADH-quinone oxidoreductase subunit L